MRDRAGESGALGAANGGGAGSPRLTPRQAQILELAAAGLSDKEIARRLHVTHRTVRTHFEKLFQQRGIRNRAQAIAIWSRRPTQGRARPADECPYPKPFPPGFAECPAYQATQMITLDISHRPLGAVWTCRHHESRLMPNTDYRWYGACAIGDAEARRLWSKSVGPGRLHEISQLRQEVSALSGPYVQRLIELKAEQEHAAAEQGSSTPGGNGQRARALSRQIEGVVDEFMTEMTRLLQARQARLLLTIVHDEAVDLVIVEGFKREAHAKIEVHRREVNKPFLFPDDCNIAGLAGDARPASFPEKMLFASLNDFDAVCDLVRECAVPLDETLRRLANHAHSSSPLVAG